MATRAELPTDELVARYKAGESTYALGRAYGVDQATACRHLRAAGVKMRRRGGPLGNKYGLGGKSRRGLHKRGGPLSTSSRGYLETRDREGKRCAVHRGCWEACCGEIPLGHLIHHIDQDRQHNDIENLMCMSRSAHTRFHRAE